MSTVDLKLEVVVLPVSDVDRAKRFYEKLGWRLDADFAFDNGFRVVQFTPPGSGASHSSAQRLRRPRPARHKAYIWWSPTSRLRSTSSPLAVSMSAKFFIKGSQARNFSPRAQALA